MNGNASLVVARDKCATPMTSLLKRVTPSGACIYSDQKPIFRQTRHCQWCVYTKTLLTVARLHKDVIDSDAFAPRH
jgi:hypothetical protein